MKTPDEKTHAAVSIRHSEPASEATQEDADCAIASRLGIVIEHRPGAHSLHQ